MSFLQTRRSFENKLQVQSHCIVFVHQSILDFVNNFFYELTENDELFILKQQKVISTTYKRQAQNQN